MWEIGDSEFHEISKCGRFQIFHLVSSGRAQLLDIGTDALPRKVKNFNSAKGAKIAAKRWAFRSA